MEQKKLCEWLRNNSSGVYRPAAEAALEIESLQAQIDEIQKAIVSLFGKSPVACDGNLVVSADGYNDLVNMLNAQIILQNETQKIEEE